MINASEIAPPALVKIDVEGAEAMVLSGARETIRRHRPVIFAEVHSTSLLEQCRKLLEAEGYAIELIATDPTAACSNDVFQIGAAPSSSA
jgi:hypothetical protein